MSNQDFLKVMHDTFIECSKEADRQGELNKIVIFLMVTLGELCDRADAKRVTCQSRDGKNYYTISSTTKEEFDSMNEMIDAIDSEIKKETELPKIIMPSEKIYH